MRIIKKNLFYNFNVFFFIGAFILIFNPPLLDVNAMHIVGGCSLVYLLFNINKTLPILCKKNILLLLFGFIGIFLYLLFVVWFCNGRPLLNAVMPVYYILDILPFGMAAKIYADKHNCQSEDFIYLLIQTGKLQAILALLAFFIPSVHTYFLDMLLAYGYTDYFSYLANYRIYGLASSLTFAMPVVQTIFALLLLYPNNNNRKTDIVGALLLFFSAIINARIAIVVAGVGLIVLVLFGKLSTTRKVILIGSLLIAALLLVNVGMPLIRQYSPWTYNWLISGMEEIYMFLGGDNSSVYFSYATGAEQYRLPDDFLSVLIGRGHTTMGADAKQYGYQSDIGFINDIWIGGVIYVVMLYSLYIRYMIKLFRTKKSLLSFIGIMMLLMDFVVNIKGQAFGRASFNVFMFLVCAVEFSGAPSKRTDRERLSENESVGFGEQVHSVTYGK